MIVYVQRDVNSKIVAVYANEQPGLADEALDDSDAGVVAFRASLVPQTPDQLYPSRVSLRQAVQGMLSDINTYLTNADVGTTAQIQTRDHAAVKGLANDLKLVIQYLASQVN